MKNTLAFLSIALLGCAHPMAGEQPSTPSVTRAHSTASEPTAEVRAPVVVTWVERAHVDASAQSTGSYILIARITQPGALSMPLRVDVEVPSGVTLVRGTPHYLVQPGPPGSVHEALFELSALATPSQDLVLVADAQGEHAGVHAEARYRFGRPAPVATSPTRGGANIVLHGIQFGQGITMTQ